MDGKRIAIGLYGKSIQPSPFYGDRPISPVLMRPDLTFAPSHPGYLTSSEAPTEVNTRVWTRY